MRFREAPFRDKLAQPPVMWCKRPFAAPWISLRLYEAICHLGMGSPPSEL